MCSKRLKVKLPISLVVFKECNRKRRCSKDNELVPSILKHLQEMNSNNKDSSWWNSKELGLK